MSIGPRTNYDMVREFHEKMGMTVDQWPPSVDEIYLRMGLIEEEKTELADEFFVEGRPIRTPSKERVAKELADLLYVVYGTAISFDIPIDSVFEEVHASNMSKLGADGKPVFREDGKVMKGPNYRKPALEWIGR